MGIKKYGTKKRVGLLHVYVYAQVKILSPPLYMLFFQNYFSLVCLRIPQTGSDKVSFVNTNMKKKRVKYPPPPLPTNAKPYTSFIYMHNNGSFPLKKPFVSNKRRNSRELCVDRGGGGGQDAWEYVHKNHAIERERTKPSCDGQHWGLCSGIDRWGATNFDVSKSSTFSFFFGVTSFPPDVKWFSNWTDNSWNYLKKTSQVNNPK